MAKRVQVAKAAQADKRARGERSGGATGGLTPQHPLPPAATSGAAAAAAKEPEKWMAQRARAHTRVGLRYQVVDLPVCLPHPAVAEGEEDAAADEGMGAAAAGSGGGVGGGAWGPGLAQAGAPNCGGISDLLAAASHGT